MDDTVIDTYHHILHRDEIEMIDWLELPSKMETKALRPPLKSFSVRKRKSE